jgi:hypothetical protein
MSVTNKADGSVGKADAAHDLRRVPLGAISGTLCGAIIGAGTMGYLQLLQELSELHDPEMSWVILSAIVGGIGGAIGGAVVGLITGLILVGRSSSGKGVRLR